MKRNAIAVAFVLVSTACLFAQVKTPKIPDTCSERSVLRDSKGKTVWFTPEQMRARATETASMPVSTASQNQSKRRVAIKGDVHIGVVVAKDGKVACAWVISGHPMLVSGVLKNAAEWKFLPPMSKHGDPMAFAGTMIFHASLDE